MSVLRGHKGPSVSQKVLQMCYLLSVLEILVQNWRVRRWLWHINIKTVTYSNSPGLAMFRERNTILNQHNTICVTFSLCHTVCDIDIRSKCHNCSIRIRRAHRTLVLQSCVCLVFILRTAQAVGNAGWCVHVLAHIHKPFLLFVQGMVVNMRCPAFIVI